MNEEIIEIMEGSTKLLVPKGSMTEKVPPKEPAFFNPRANLSRDLSIIACSAFWKDYKFPKIFFIRYFNPVKPWLKIKQSRKYFRRRLECCWRDLTKFFPLKIILEKKRNIAIIFARAF